MKTALIALAMAAVYGADQEMKPCVAKCKKMCAKAEDPTKCFWGCAKKSDCKPDDKPKPCVMACKKACAGEKTKEGAMKCFKECAAKKCGGDKPSGDKKCAMGCMEKSKKQEDPKKWAAWCIQKFCDKEEEEQQVEDVDKKCAMGCMKKSKKQDDPKKWAAMCIKKWCSGDKPEPKPCVMKCKKACAGKDNKKDAMACFKGCTAKLCQKGEEETFVEDLPSSSDQTWRI